MNSKATSPGSPAQHTALRTGSLGVTAIVFFVVATVGPMSALIGGIPLAFALGPGTGVPGLFLFVAALLILFSVGYTAMSRHVVDVGGFYVYIGSAFGRRAQQAAGLVALFSYHTMILALWALLSLITSAFIHEAAGWNVSWIVVMLAGLALVGVLGRRDVNLSAGVLGVLMLAEVAVIAVMDVAVFLQTPASGFTAAPFELGHIFQGDVGAGFMFCVVVFIGFEATAIYSEEAKDPRRTIPRAAYVSVGVIALFHIVSSWALVLAYGTDHVQNAALGDMTNFVYAVADNSLGGTFVVVMKVLFVTSTFAACLGVHNAVSRYQFSLAREGILPRKLAQTHPKWMSPHHSSLAQTVIAMVVILAFHLAGVAPTTIFSLLLAMGTFGLIVLMGALCFAVMYFFGRDHRGENWWVRLAAPLIAGAGFTTVIVLLLKNWDVQTGSSAWFAAYLPWLVPVLAVIGFFLPGSAAGLGRRQADPPVGLAADQPQDTKVEAP
ncbi:APC family permease [Streptomyces europaeiscabiei]|uniref:APC family permease n=1 Tax=Streptomyces europaeiscabiei TaxID=146819 RepID=UPI0038F77E0F